MTFVPMFLKGRVLPELGLQQGHPIPQRLVLRDQLNQTTLQMNDPLGNPIETFDRTARA